MKKNLKLNAFISNVLFAKWYYVLICFAVLLCTGCSLFGLMIGSAISRHPTITLKGWQAQKIIESQELSLFLKDQGVIQGKFNGMDSMTLEEYTAAYELQKVHLPPGVILPSLNDTVFIKLKNEISTIPQIEFRYVFAGFDINGILLRPVNNPGVTHVPYTLVESIRDKSGHLNRGTALSEMALSGVFPSRFKIRMNVNGSIRTILPSDVIQVIMKNKATNASGIGFAIGLGIDLVVAITALIASSSSGPPPVNRGGASCPYIYSYDGHQYRLDGETFGGAIFKAAQRTDLDNLDYLKESNGNYKLKLTNELQETQYIDEFKLMVVDHPIGSIVMPGFTGNLYALNALNPPIKATDQNGNNVLDLVTTKDEKIWISNPFTRNPEIKSDGRDAMILEFKKPVHAASVKLVFNVQNTDWAAYLQGQMLALHGNKLDEWYAMMNGSKVAQAAFKQIMIREGMLLIQLWDGQAWKTKEYVWEVGPRVPKDQVVKLNLGNYTEDNLRIRLESTVGFWMINSVEADYTDDVPIHSTELSATKATDQSGRDLVEILSHTDGQYYAQPADHDWAEIIFKAIPALKNSNRTFILKCNGYYTIHADTTGTPQQGLLNKLMYEPGAYGQFTLQLLNRNMANAYNNQNLK